MSIYSWRDVWNPATENTDMTTNTSSTAPADIARVAFRFAAMRRQDPGKG